MGLVGSGSVESDPAITCQFARLDCPQHAPPSPAECIGGPPAYPEKENVSDVVHMLIVINVQHFRININSAVRSPSVLHTSEEKKSTKGQMDMPP